MQFIATGGDVPHHSLLPAPAVSQWDSLLKASTAKWKAAQASLSRRHVADLNGCLEKLAATLLQADRIRRYHDYLIHLAKSQANPSFQGFALQGSDACADFEGFLLQGRAALDRLSWFVSDRYMNKCDSFRRIGNVLSDFAAKDQAAAELLSIVTSAHGWFDGTFGKLESPQSFRDLVAHHHALVEGTRTCFGVQRVSEHSALLIDCEIELPGLDTRLPVFNTTHVSIRHLAFIILNSVSLFLEVDRMQLEQYDTTWEMVSVTLSDYILPQAPGTPLGAHTLSSVRNMNPDGFVVGTDNVDPTLFDHTFSL